MINEEKVKIMDRLALYEKQEGGKYLPVSKYYRSDYIGLALIKNFFLVTIGYGLILAVIAAYNLEYLLDNVHKMDLISLGIVVRRIYRRIGGVFGTDIYSVHREVSQCQEEREAILHPAYQAGEDLYS